MRNWWTNLTSSSSFFHEGSIGRCQKAIVKNKMMKMHLPLWKCNKVVYQVGWNQLHDGVNVSWNVFDVLVFNDCTWEMDGRLFGKSWHMTCFFFFSLGYWKRTTTSASLFVNNNNNNKAMLIGTRHSHNKQSQYCNHICKHAGIYGFTRTRVITCRSMSSIRVVDHYHFSLQSLW